MADLSPAAQAVVNKIAASDCIDRGDVYYRQVATVTIRAVADLVVPLELGPPEQAPIDSFQRQDQRSKTRRELLALATELEGSI
jgi:hypothetical protein